MFHPPDCSSSPSSLSSTLSVLSSRWHSPARNEPLRCLPQKFDFGSREGTVLTMGRTGAIANDAGPDELSCLRSSAPRMAPARTTGRRRAASRRGAGGARGLGSGARLRGPLAYESPSAWAPSQATLNGRATTSPLSLSRRRARFALSSRQALCALSTRQATVMPHAILWCLPDCTAQHSTAQHSTAARSRTSTPGTQPQSASDVNPERAASPRGSVRCPRSGAEGARSPRDQAHDLGSGDLR